MTPTAERPRDSHQVRSVISDALREEYLRRIGLDPRSVTRADGATLARLQRAHLEQVPFENLDIHLGRAIDMTPEALVDKVAVRHRGGFCYELNGSFAQLLASVGFPVWLLEAWVDQDGELGIPFDHLTLMVNIGHDVMVDVGFGRGPQAPLPIASDADPSPRGYSVVPVSGLGLDDIMDAPGPWWDLQHDGSRRYRFSLTPQPLGAFRPAAQYHQHSAESHFTKGIVISRPDGNGRVSLSGLTLIDHIVPDAEPGGDRSGAAPRHQVPDVQRHRVHLQANNLAGVLDDRFSIRLSGFEIDHLVATVGRGATMIDTDLGPTGVAWNDNRIIGIELPHADPDDTWEATAARVGEAEPRVPPVIVARGIELLRSALAGDAVDVREIPVNLDACTPFEREIFELARTIPAGQIMTYGAMARAVGRRGGSQAVGAALGRNPVPIAVPCHRIVASDRSLGGFSAAGGVDQKRQLLESEGAPIDRRLL